MTGERVSCNRYVTMEFKLGTRFFKKNFILAPIGLPGIRVILGEDWMDKEGVTLVSGNGNFVLRNVSGGGRFASALTDAYDGSATLPSEISDFKDVFGLDLDPNLPAPVPRVRGGEFRISTRGDQLPAPATAYPMSDKDLAEEKKQIEELLANGRIRPSSSHTAVKP